MDCLERARNLSKRIGISTGSIGRSLSRSSWIMEEALKWAAIERLPTYDRLRTIIMQSFVDHEIVRKKVEHREVDVTKLDVDDRQKFMDMLFKVAEEDNEKYLMKFRNRIDRVGIKLPTVEVRFEHLTIDANCYIGSRALPSLSNVTRNIAESVLGMLGIQLAKTTNLTILKDVSGIVKPSRMTLLLGPPSSGKTTLLLALAGKLDASLRVKGESKRSSILHIGEMTVKETLDFSAKCQGVGNRYDLLRELARREKEAGIFPEANFDLFMKATAMEGVESSLITDYTLKLSFHLSNKLTPFKPIARFFKQFLLVFLTQQMAAGLFRLIIGLCRTMVIANTGGALTLLLVFLFQNVSINDKVLFLGSQCSFNILFTFALAHLDPLGKPQAVISEETTEELEANYEGITEEPRLRRPKSSKDSFPRSFSTADALNSKEMEIRRMSSRTNPNGMSRTDSSLDAAIGVAPKRGMVLPFTPLAMSFDTVNYYVDMPPV
ncbi:hypothetical protein V6N13_137527 [Hibiscus sabdariffa]